MKFIHIFLIFDVSMLALAVLGRDVPFFMSDGQVCKWSKHRVVQSIVAFHHTLNISHSIFICND